MKFEDFAELPILLYETDLLVVEKDGISILSFNFLNFKSVEKFTGWEEKDFANPDFWFKNVHEEDKEKIYKSVASMKDGALLSCEYRFRKKDGSYAFIKDTFHVVQISPNRFRNFGLITDITKEKQLLKHFEEQSQLLNVITDHSPVGIAVYDKTGFVYINPTFKNIFGYTLEELKEKNIKIWHLFYSKKDRKIKMKIIDERLQGKNIPESWQNVKAVTKDGRVISIDVKGNTIKRDDTYAGVLIVVDVTERYENQKKIQQAYKKLKEYEEYRTNFLRSITHDLKTPLNVVYGNIQLMENGIFGNASAFKEPLSSIKKAVENSIVLINDILDLSKIEAKKEKIRMKELKFSDFSHVIEQYKFLANDKGLNFTFGFEGKKTFSGDPKILSQIISNLLNNAVKYTDSGGVTGLMKIEDARIVIEVSDTGKGISNEMKERIFEPFLSGEGSTGLGLSLVKRFVELLNGRINFDSQIGRGTKFFVEIPQISKPLNYTTKEKKEVLLIIPDEETRRLLKTILVNHSIVEAVNAKEGYLKALEHKPDLVITTMALPDEIGNKLVEKMRADEELADTSFVIYTGARLSKEDVNTYMIKKDENIKQVAEELEKLLGERIVLIFEESTQKYTQQVKEFVHSFSTKEIIVKKLSELTEDVLYLNNTFVLLVSAKSENIKKVIKRFVRLRSKGLMVVIALVMEGGNLKWHF